MCDTPIACAAGGCSLVPPRTPLVVEPALWIPVLFVSPRSFQVPVTRNRHAPRSTCKPPSSSFTLHKEHALRLARLEVVLGLAERYHGVLQDLSFHPNCWRRHVLRWPGKHPHGGESNSRVRQRVRQKFPRQAVGHFSQFFHHFQSQPSMQHSLCCRRRTLR